MGRPGQIVNISGTTPVDDPEYRYKMPTVYGKIEGKGNGIKTVIPNISDVGLSLHRDAGEVNKFFGCELGAQTTYNTETDRAVVNGAHTDQVLQQMVHKYIELFVLCPNCRLPETEYKIKSGMIYHKCAACGNKDAVDMTHKLCTYILAQDKSEFMMIVERGGGGIANGNIVLTVSSFFCILLTMVQKPSRTQRRVARRIKTKRRRRRNPKRMEGEWCTEKLVLVVLRLLEKLCKWGISMFIPLSLNQYQWLGL